MEFSRAEVAEATPTNLRRAVEAGGYLPMIVRWSRSQPPGTDPLPWHAFCHPCPRLAWRCQRHARDRVCHRWAAGYAV